MFAEFARDYGTLVLTGMIFLAGVAWGLVRWVTGKQFATKKDVAEIYEKMAQLGQVMQDADSEQEKAITQVGHRMELMERDLKNMPGFTEHNRLRDDMGAIKEKVVESSVKLGNMASDIEEIKLALRDQRR